MQLPTGELIIPDCGAEGQEVTGGHAAGGGRPTMTLTGPMM